MRARTGPRGGGPVSLRTFAGVEPRAPFDLSRLTLEQADALIWHLASLFDDRPPGYAVHCYEQGAGVATEGAKYAAHAAKTRTSWRWRG